MHLWSWTEGQDCLCWWTLLNVDFSWWSLKRELHECQAKIWPSSVMTVFPGINRIAPTNLCATVSKNISLFNTKVPRSLIRIVILWISHIRMISGSSFSPAILKWDVWTKNSRLLQIHLAFNLGPVFSPSCQEIGLSVPFLLPSHL